MAVSPYVKALDNIQKTLTGFLKPLGFKKKGRTYNRKVADGLVQAVNLQMGQFPIGEYVIPGVRESHYGRFTVNLGVALPAVRAVESGRAFPAFVQEYECEIRERLTHLVFHEDTWFDLDHQVEKTANDITRYMDSLGVPFLEEFESYNAVLVILDKRSSLPSSNAGRSSLVGAMICVHLKQLDRARVYFDRAAEYASQTEGLPATSRPFGGSAGCNSHLGHPTRCGLLQRPQHKASRKRGQSVRISRHPGPTIAIAEALRGRCSSTEPTE